MADEGLRVLGVARAFFSHDEGLPEIQHDFAFEFIGLVGLQDPIREDVPTRSRRRGPRGCASS